MKKGLILFLTAILLFMVYMPVTISWSMTEHDEKVRKLSQNHLYGLNLYGQDRKTEVRFEEFLDYSRDVDYINHLTAWLWYSNDTLHVEMKGQDAYPGLRQTLATSVFDKTNDMSNDDKIKISVDEGYTQKKHLNYHFTFGGFAQIADNLNGKYEEGSRRACDAPWSLKADGADWTFSAAIPLHGQKKIGLNLMRKFYGGRNVGLASGNDPAQFFLVHMM